jgi:G3E family GTPase
MDVYDGNGLSRITSAVIVDASRFDVILKALGRPLTNQVSSADLILINKMDTVSGSEIERMTSVLRDINQTKPIIPISATEGTNLDKVVDTLVM